MGRKAELETGAKEGRSVQLDLEPVTAHVAADFHNRTGGSSFYVHGGERATEGYAIGGLEGAPESHYEENLTPEQYQEHRDRVRASVAETSAIAGSWKEDGTSVMDASSVTQDRNEAKATQIARKQRAVYNLGKKKDEDLR